MFWLCWLESFESNMGAYLSTNVIAIEIYILYLIYQKSLIGKRFLSFLFCHCHIAISVPQCRLLVLTLTSDEKKRHALGKQQQIFKKNWKRRDERRKCNYAATLNLPTAALFMRIQFYALWNRISWIYLLKCQTGKKN